MIAVIGIIGMIVFIVFCSFLGMWLGAYIHHRGVSLGSGSRESFTGAVPEGSPLRFQ